MCDSLVALKAGTRNGNMIFAKNSDRAVNEPQYFVHVPAADFNKDASVCCTYIDIPQVSHTHEMILSKPSWVWGAEIGVNEHGVCIGNEAVYSKKIQKNPSLIGMDFVRLGLERASTAKEAVNVITSILEEYDQGGNGSFDAEFYYDNSFMIMDADEAWVLETAGSYWAAKMLRKTDSISNYMCIGKPDLIHRNAVRHAEECKWTTSEPFDFADAYIDWDAAGNYNGMVRRNCSQRLLDGDEGDITAEKVLKVLQSHTTNAPFVKGNYSVCKHADGPDGQHQTTNSLIVELRPDEILMWGSGMSIPCISPYKPFWFDMYSDRLVFDYGEQEQAVDSWIKREKLNRSIACGRIKEDDYKADLDEMQKQWFDMVRETEKKDRQKICEQISDQEEQFLKKWLNTAEAAETSPIGDEKYKAFWSVKNNELGRNRKIAY